MARSTIQDVAKLAGVSEATVSRALRGLTNVAPATRERVEAAAAELRFTLSKSASSLASGKTHRILLLVSGGLNNWFNSS
ncbi:LacI family DNA-binding transcriptional regulator, partial [Bifidobacterium pullorum]